MGITDEDCEQLFRENLLNHMEPQDVVRLKEHFFLLQNSRFYKKFSGQDFSAVREPMYKYSKSAKERLLRNKFNGFLFIFFLTYGKDNIDVEIEEQLKERVLQDFTRHSMDGLRESQDVQMLLVYASALLGTTGGGAENTTTPGFDQDLVTPF